MINSKGLRLNVGIILFNRDKKLFWARRVGGQEAWQFPQGGMQANENAEQAMFRELYEEVGLAPSDVKLIATSKRWLTYYLPKRYRREYSKPLCIGQTQKWFLLQLTSAEESINFSYSPTPEFSASRWVDYWYPLQHIILFKRAVYRQILQEFAPYVD